VAEAEQFWREACEKNRIRRLTQDKPRPLFCMAGVISLAAVLGDSIPSSAHHSKKRRRRKRESALGQRYENVRSFFSARRRVYADAFLISEGVAGFGQPDSAQFRTSGH
jgi:hypothetical protein